MKTFQTFIKIIMYVQYTLRIDLDSGGFYYSLQLNKMMIKTELLINLL